MRPNATQITIAILALTLVACGGSGDGDSTIASRVAAAASRSLVDAMTETSERDLEEKVDQTAQPLALASSRPDAILGTAPEANALSSYHTDAMAQALRGTMTLDSATTSLEGVGHRITATVISDYNRKCTETARMNLVAESEASLEMPPDASPLSKRPALNLTRI